MCTPSKLTLVQCYSSSYKFFVVASNTHLLLNDHIATQLPPNSIKMIYQNPIKLSIKSLIKFLIPNLNYYHSNGFYS